MKLSEKHIARTCREFMELDGWRAVGMEPISRREWGKGTGEIGQPDCLFLRYSWGVGAEVIWVEFKSKGGKVGINQSAWHARERQRGGIVWVATQDFDPTIESFQALYRRSGFMRRKI